MERAEFSAGDVLGQAWWLFRDRPLGGLAAAAVLTALGIGADLMPDSMGLRLTAAVGILSIVLQHQLMRERLHRLGLLSAGFQPYHLIAFFGVSILTTLGIMLGLVLLVIPGLLLLVRWTVAGPALIAEDLGVVSSMRRSWDESRGRFRVIVVVLLVVYSPFVALLLAIGASAAMGMDEGLPMIILFNVGANPPLVFGWYATVALYARMREGTAGIADIFA